MKALILFFSLLFVTIITDAQSGATITGNVTDSSGTSLNFATVKIFKINKDFITDSTGSFTIGGLAAGSYTLRISSAGFQQKDETIQLNENEMKTVVFILAPAISSSLDEVVVTSRSRQQLKEDFTTAVTIVNSRTLQELQTVNNNVSDILAVTVPGLALSSGTSSNWGQTLRGRQALILIDGVPQSTPLRNGSVDIRTIDPSALERIEVIKGATSIYGNGAAGGIINYITKNNAGFSKKIASKTEIASTGSLLHTKGSIGGRISQLLYGRIGKLDYTASGSYEKTGLVKDAEGDILGPTYGLSNNRIYNGFAKLGYQLNQNQRLQLSYNFFKSLEETDLAEVMGSIKDGRKTMAVAGNTPGSSPGTRWNHNALLKYINDKFIGNTSLNLSGYIQNFNTVFFYSDRFEGGGQSTIQSSKKGFRVDMNTPFSLLNVISGDINYGMDVLQDITSQPLLDGRTWVPEMNMVSKGPFLQIQTTILKNLVFNGGLRFENMNISVEDYATLKPYNNNGTFGNSIDVKGGDLKYNNLVFNSGIRFNQYKAFKPYLNFSQGFSVADVGLVLRAATVDDISKIQTEAVVVDNYEAGFVTELKSFRIEAAAYISKSKLGSSFEEKDGFYVITRQPERVYGYEIAADAYPVKNIMVGATYTYVEGKRDGNKNNSYNDTEDTYLGGERIAPPKFTAYLKYTTLKDLNIRIDFIASGKRERFTKNASGVYKTYEGKVEPYELVNISSSYRIAPSVLVKLGIENLLNKDYFPSRSLWPSINQYYVKGRGTSLTVGLSIDVNK
jgi:iron complex outermembrane recepter protein